MTLRDVIQKSMGWDNTTANANCPVVEQAILSWFKEQLPKERKPMMQDFTFYENGYNQCLKDILTNLTAKQEER